MKAFLSSSSKEQMPIIITGVCVAIIPRHRLLKPRKKEKWSLKGEIYSKQGFT